MVAWIIVMQGSYYGPFATKAQAAAWAEWKFGPYRGEGKEWVIADLWNPKHVD